jgi:hypothetical protein
MLPAQQRFKSNQATSDGELRLVVDEELARDRGPQVVLKRPRLPQTQVGRAIKEPHGSAAVGLCALEAASAFAINDATSPPSLGNTATPMLAPSWIECSATEISLSIDSRRRSANDSAPEGCGPSMTNVNSSPPLRAR